MSTLYEKFRPSAPVLPCTLSQGWSLANEMLIMGRKLSAQEALAAGLISTLVTAETEGDFLRQVGHTKHLAKQYRRKPGGSQKAPCSGLLALKH